jgi:hypothetical protein
MFRGVWSEEDDAIIGGDLTAALAYVTPAGGAVVTPVAPIGLRDRDAGTVGFTTSLGFGRKLDRIKLNPNVALAYHAREHGFASSPRYVLVQGTATYDAQPDEELLERELLPASTKFMGPPKRGVFWDRWLSAYYGDRVVVTVKVTRVVSWPDRLAQGEPDVAGEPFPESPPDSQRAPSGGTGPRVDAERSARKAKALPHVLASWVGGDGMPTVVPVQVGEGSASGIALRGPLPGGERRAGLLAHSYRPQLIGLTTRQHTGWLADSAYAPHTEGGFAAPPNKTLLLLANGFMARRGLAAARKAGRS